MPRCCCFFSLASNPSKEKVLSVIDQSTLELNGRRIKNLRLAWPPPRHLIAFALLSVLTLVIVHLSPQSNRETSQLLSLALVILIPGYLLTLALFPSRMDLTMQRRALLSIGICCIACDSFRSYLKPHSQRIAACIPGHRPISTGLIPGSSILCSLVGAAPQK